MQETSGKARYFAFISHKSTDTKFALKMHRFIESYNLPTAVRKMTPAPKRLTPLCSYEIDFSANPLLDEMREKLRQSQYLILICSESLVKSGTKFVNYEIETFMQCRREEGVDPLRRIIPIIVSGAFDSPEHECCPEALKALGDNRPIAVDRQKCKNDREVFLRAISGMLDIDFAVLENRDHKRQSVRRMIAAGAAALALAAGICLGEYFIPRQYHYADFVMQNGVPVGIERLSRREYEGTASHYVITVQKHRVTSLRHVNARGSTVLPPEDPMWAELPEGIATVSPAI